MTHANSPGPIYAAAPGAVSAGAERYSRGERMLWTAALLSLIIWAIGRESGFLGVSVHVFLLLGLLAVLAALLPPRPAEDPDE